MNARILKPINCNAAIHSVFCDYETEKLLKLSKMNETKDSDIDSTIISLISPDLTDDEALARVYSVGSKLIPYLMKVSFDKKLPSTEGNDETLPLQRLLSLPIVVEKINSFEVLLRYLIRIAYETKNIKARIFTMHLLEMMCATEDNQAVLGRYPGFIHMVVHTIGETSNDEVKEKGASIIFYLATNNRNKSFFSEPKIVDLVAELCSDKKYSVQLLAVDTLQNISKTAGRHESFLVSFRGGLLLEILKRLTKDILRRRVVVSALKTITNLTTNMTASQILVSQPSLLSLLAMQAADCCLDDIALTAAIAIKKFAMLIDATHGEHKSLLRALAIMLVSPSKTVVEVALNSLSSQASRKMNCLAIASCHHILSEITALLSLAKHNRVIQKGVLVVLKKIASDPVSSSIVIDNPKLLTKVLGLSKLDDCIYPEIREFAMKVTLTLVTHKNVAVKLADKYGFRIGFMV